MTPEELQAEWGPGDDKAVSYLRERGYRLGPNAMWIMPFGKYVDDKDCRAALYLHQNFEYDRFMHEDRPQWIN